MISQERGKANMERMEESSEIEYHRYQQFITDSPWSAEAVLSDVGRDVWTLAEQQKALGGRSTGLLIDESGHAKSGRHSVGVARQYLGQRGKVDNGQVGVYLSLINEGIGSLIDERLYLPKSWTRDKRRCQKAGIPALSRVYQSKPALALQMLDSALEAGISFDWVGGDGLYGHSYELGKSLDDRDLAFLLEVHRNQRVYLQIFEPYLPERKTLKGRKPTRLKSNVNPMRLDHYVGQLGEQDWTRLRVRKTAKGWLEADYHARPCWVWDGKEARPRSRTLLIRRDFDANGQTIRLKYCLANTRLEQTPIEELAYRQSQRYWIERLFQDAKQELGLSDYQVRKWNGWHHHHAICLLALYLLQAHKWRNRETLPLMSLRDARILLTTQIALTQLDGEPDQRVWNNMIKRHQKRQRDINRRYRGP